MQKILPVYLENSFEKLYGNFGYRFASLLLEFVIVLPITLLVLFFNNSDLYNNYYTLPINQLLVLFIYVYLPVRYGATPGKLMMGLRILKLDGTAIGYKESFLRYLPMLIFGLISGLVALIGVSNADSTAYHDLGWLDKQKYLQSFSFPWHFIIVGFINLYYLASLVFYLLDDRNRSLNDLIAGTVVVKSQLQLEIEEWVEHNETSNQELKN